jgi:hypothetical protein
VPDPISMISRHPRLCKQHVRSTPTVLDIDKADHGAVVLKRSAPAHALDLAPQRQPEMSIRMKTTTTCSGRWLAGILLAAVLLPVGAAAQSAQMVSLQISGLGAVPFGGGLSNVTTGAGWEAQLRVNPSAFSIGAGVEQTFHTISGISGRNVTLLGGFLEPRYVIDFGSDKAVFYLSGRAALSQITVEEGGVDRTGTGYTLNGGGGFLVRLGGRTNLDLGATMGYKDLGIVTLSTGTFDLGTGANVVGRIGLAIGIG